MATDNRPKDARVKQAYKEQGTHGGPPQHGQSARGPDDDGNRGQQDHGKKDGNRDN